MNMAEMAQRIHNKRTIDSMRKRGETDVAIAAFLGVSRQRIGQIAGARGDGQTGRPQITPRQRSAIIIYKGDLATRRITQAEVAAMVGVSLPTLRKYLREEN